MQKRRTGRIGAAALGLALLVASCGSDDKKSDETTATTAAATTTAAGSATTAAGTDTTAAGSDTTTASADTTAESMVDDTSDVPADTTGDTADVPSDSSGGGATDIPTGVKCDGVTLAFLGALSGDNGALGQNMVDGATVAIDEFNEANPDCKVTFDTSYDSQGAPEQATPLATTIANDDSIVGLIGPGFSGETKATMPTFETAGLPMITPGATNALLSTNGWKMFHRILANDDKQAPGIVQLITGTIGGEKVGVIDDASDYGKGLADAVRKGLADLDVADSAIVPASGDFSSAVNAMKDAGVDTVFYSGYYAEAAKMVQQLRDAGVEATFVSGDGSLDVGFIDDGGAATEGAYLTATGAPPDVNPEFQQKFNDAYGKDPTLYAPEAYDAAWVFLHGIAEGKVTRADLAEYISSYDAEGITKHIKFDETGEPEGDAVFYTVVEDGKLVSKGLVPA